MVTLSHVRTVTTTRDIPTPTATASDQLPRRDDEWRLPREGSTVEPGVSVVAGHLARSGGLTAGWSGEEWHKVGTTAQAADGDTGLRGWCARLPLRRCRSGFTPPVMVRARVLEPADAEEVAPSLLRLLTEFTPSASALTTEIVARRLGSETLRVVPSGTAKRSDGDAQHVRHSLDRWLESRPVSGGSTCGTCSADLFRKVV
ncbi:MAG: hypothetical protein QOG99_1455 [Frankiales bacterium]|jgi:hypothetical protein|nr:hypothetical protein [Frankiales bacterium]